MFTTKRNYLVFYKFQYGPSLIERKEIIPSRTLELDPYLVSYLELEVDHSIVEFINDYEKRHTIGYFMPPDSVVITNIIPMDIFEIE